MSLHKHGNNVTIFQLRYLVISFLSSNNQDDFLRIYTYNKFFKMSFDYQRETGHKIPSLEHTVLNIRNIFVTRKQQ